MPAGRPSRSKKQIAAAAEYAAAQEHLADVLAALAEARKRVARAENELHNLSLNASQEALKAVERVTGSGKVSGADLLASPKLKRQLAAAKKKLRKTR